MRRSSTINRNGGGGPGGRIRPGERLVSLVSTLALVASLCPSTQALARATEEPGNETQLAASEQQGEDQQADGNIPVHADGAEQLNEDQPVDGTDQHADDATTDGATVLETQADEIIVTKDTHVMSTGTYRVTGIYSTIIDPDDTGNGIRVEEGANVLLIIDAGARLLVFGADAVDSGVGHAAILLPEGSTLFVTGGGELIAQGGNAGKGEDGGGAVSSTDICTGAGGHGGRGGGGAGARIGTDGGAGGAGADGDEGASEDGDDTASSRLYAKAGGAGGTSAAPKTVPFYTFKDGPGSTPKAESIMMPSGTTRDATALGSIEAFKGVGGVTAEYDGQPHGAPVDNLSAQSDGTPSLGMQSEALALGTQDDNEYDWAESGTVDVDSVEVAYKVAYFDAAGESLGEAPTKPGQYVAVVRYAAPAGHEDLSGEWVVPIEIAKHQVEAPTPAALTFECADWETGAGARQEAFPELGDGVEFVADAVAEDYHGQDRVDLDFDLPEVVREPAQDRRPDPVRWRTWLARGPLPSPGACPPPTQLAAHMRRHI